MSSDFSPAPGVDAPIVPPSSVQQDARENPPFSGWDVTKIGLLLFLVPAFIEPFVVVFAQKALYPQLSFQDVSHKAWVLLGPQFVWFAIVAVYLIISAKDWFHQTLWRAIQWNWPQQGWFSLIAVGIATVVLLQL